MGKTICDPVSFPNPTDPKAKHSEETLTIGGKKYKCHLATFVNGKSTYKEWTSPEVPGFRVKSTDDSEGDKTFDGVVEVIKIDLK